jgi:hypothetical protein
MAEKRRQSAAQKLASERNLRKGNPRAYSGSADQEKPKTKPPAKDTYRAKPKRAAAPKPKTKRAKPKAQKAPPPADVEIPPAAEPRKSSGGLFSGFLEGISG